MNRIEVNKRNGSKGGKRTSQVMSDEGKRERARSGGQSTLCKYGSEYYSNLARRSRNMKLEGHLKIEVINDSGVVHEHKELVTARVTKSGKLSFDGLPPRKALEQGQRVKITFQIDYKKVKKGLSQDEDLAALMDRKPATVTG